MERNFENTAGTMIPPSLVLEIEGAKYDLCFFQDALAQTTAALQRLEQRLAAVLGVQADGDVCGEAVPGEFRDHGLQLWARCSELEDAEQIIACWYFAGGFPWNMSWEKLQRVERKLQEQLEALDAEEAAYEARQDADFWQYRRDIKVEQLEQIQTMMWNFDQDGEEWEE